MYYIHLKTMILFVALHIALFVITVILITWQRIRLVARRFRVANR